MSERLTLKTLIEYAHRLDQELKDKYDRLAYNAVMRDVNSSSVLAEYDKASNEAIQVVSDGLLELGKEPLSFKQLDGYRDPSYKKLTPEDKWRHMVAYVNDLYIGGVYHTVKDIIELNGWK